LFGVQNNPGPAVGVAPITDAFDDWRYRDLSQFVRTYEKENNTFILSEDQETEGRIGQKRNYHDLYNCAQHIFAQSENFCARYDPALWQAILDGYSQLVMEQVD
jgi:hypothetical protein